MASSTPHKSKKPKGSLFTLSPHEDANADPRDNVPISLSMAGLEVDDEVDSEEHAKKKKSSKSKSPVPKKEKKEKEKQREKEKEKAKEEKTKEKKKDKEKEKEKEKEEDSDVETPKRLPKEKGKKAVTTTSPKQEKEKKLNVKDSCAPAMLVSKVRELGMKPLFENYLTPKLRQFKHSDEFKERAAEDWNLLREKKIPKNYVYRAEDFEYLTPEDLLKSLLSQKDTAGVSFWFFLGEHRDGWMWECAVDFDYLMKKDTPFGEFVPRLSYIIGVLSNKIFAKEYPENFQALKKLLVASDDYCRGKTNELHF